MSIKRSVGMKVKRYGAGICPNCGSANTKDEDYGRGFPDQFDDRVCLDCGYVF